MLKSINGDTTRLNIPSTIRKIKNETFIVSVVKKKRKKNMGVRNINTIKLIIIYFSNLIEGSN